MLSSSPRDNWERLVAAVVKKDQIWQLCHQDSITTASSFSCTPSNSSREILSISSNRSPRQPLLTSASGSEEGRKNGSKTVTQKLFSALLWRRKPKEYDLGQGLVGISENHVGLKSFHLHELLFATDEFSNNNVLGRGGNGTVYKGQLQDGSIVAVKRLHGRVTETELEMANFVGHRNIIELCGFCIAQNEQLLVYPYMENGSVASYLRGRGDQQSSLIWSVREMIALGVARGLAYLHHECFRGIIHRDVKAANILLDRDFKAVIGDFTLAKFMDCDDDDGVKGTLGHIAPEYLSTNKCSEKTDVFGYGIFLLELVTGKQAVDLDRLANVMLLDWVKELLKERLIQVVVDLPGDEIDEEVEKLLQIALICTQSDPKERPPMLDVVRMLEGGVTYDITERWEDLLRSTTDKLHLADPQWFIMDSIDGKEAEVLSGPR